ATQALKDIIASGVAPAAIDEVAVSVPAPHLKMIDHGVVAGDRASHLTSVQYAMAAAALAPEMAFDVQQTPPDLPPAVRGLMAKLKVEADARLLADYPVSWPARVRVAAGSARHEREVTHVPGDPALPFDRESVRKKFLRFTQPALGAENAERILARCSGVLATGAFSQLIDDIEQACSVDACSPSGRGQGDSGNQDSSVSTRRGLPRRSDPPGRLLTRRSSLPKLVRTRLVLERSTISDREHAMLRRIIAVAALLIQLVCAAITSGTPARAIDEIEMGSVGGPTALLWPLYIGTATGMFAAENLDIKQIFAPSSAGVQQQLAAGAFQISDSGLIDQVRAIFEGAPIALARIEGQVPPYALLAQRTIKTIAELRGKTIMVGGEKDITRVYLERMLTPNGIKAGEYDLLSAGSTLARFAALQSGAVSAAILFPPLNFRAEAAGFTNLGFIVDYAKNLPFSGISVNTSWAARNKERLEKFLAVYTKAVVWFN